LASAVLNDPTNAASSQYLYRFPAWMFLLVAALLALVYVAFSHAIAFMIGQWNMEEFSHGYLIPFISGFLVWQRRGALRRVDFKGSWTGLAVVVAGVGLDVAGQLTALWTVQHIALLVVVVGLVLALAGWRALRILGVPLGVLVFMIPLPNILLNTLSGELQLISSSLGVWLIRLCGVAVFLEGNVIDLGSYRLEVAQACSGLRYLLPLMTLAFLIACFYRASFRKRAVVFLSSIPITLVMNSLRIAVIGVTVDRWGPAMAEGLLHEVQGWMMFMLSTAMLVLEVIVLARLGKDPRPWREVFGLEMPVVPAGPVTRRSRAPSTPLLAAGAVLLLFALAALALPAPIARIPERETFASFPLDVAGWSGKREVMDRIYSDSLKLDDYLLANYVKADDLPVNLYVAWYDTQHAGESTHSPKACLPGGGWVIEDLRQLSIDHVNIGAQPLRVNRALIRNQNQRQLVYYWFQQRGRVITNEYLVKWYLLVDSVSRHRTDGALVRLVVPLSISTSVNDADRELQGFVSAIAPRLGQYVPG
jgi:exosortase D (VPLPA-CTERM-specific)